MSSVDAALIDPVLLFARQLRGWAGARSVLRQPTLLLDCSLSLINQTGAHFIAEDLSSAFADRAVVRRWRLLDTPLPRGKLRKLLGRLMLRELRLARGNSSWPWPEPHAKAIQRVFLDPLYVLRSRLAASDIVLCHDVGPVTHPHLYDGASVELYRTAYERLKRVGPGLVFVSQASRVAFEREFGTRFRFRCVIPLYVRGGSIEGAAQPVHGVGASFLLTVGALERRKNQVAAIRAFGASGLSATGLEYVLCGARGQGGAEILALAASTPGVRVLGYVSDSELRWLYRNATAFVLPSLLEGFGMPALEAARYGLIPIVSRDSALSEAVGGLGIAVAPEDVDELANAMRAAVEMPPNRRATLRHALTMHAASATRERFIDAWRQLLDAELGEREARLYGTLS